MVRLQYVREWDTPNEYVQGGWKKTKSANLNKKEIRNSRKIHVNNGLCRIARDVTVTLRQQFELSFFIFYFYSSVFTTQNGAR